MLNTNYNIVNKYNVNKSQHASFKARQRTVDYSNETKLHVPNAHKINKVKAFIMGGLLSLSAAISCNSSSRSNVCDFDEMQGLEVRYTDVKPETKDSIIEPVYELKSKLTSENDFLDGIKIDIAKNYSKLDDSDAFSRYLKTKCNTKFTKGVSFYSDSQLPRRIVVQQDSHTAADKMLNFANNGSYSNLPAMKHTLMHEVGHHFDSYFGHDHNEDYALKWDSIVANKDNPFTISVDKEEDKDIRADYFFNADLSDSQEFKDALLKDIKHVRELKENNPDKLACSIDYYTQDIDLSKEPDEQEIHLAEFARSEVYANLFSYAMGEDNGDKRDFLDNFANSYKVVKKDINTYLNISK